MSFIQIGQGILLGLCAFALMFESAFAALTPGSDLPSSAAEVKMRSVDGRLFNLEELRGAKGTLVVFSCNHCPWAKAWEERIVQAGNAALQRGIGVAMINANDPSAYPEDRFEVMIERAKSRGMQFPYLVDETSDVARAFGAGHTPEIFLFDAAGKLVYTGAFDDNADDPGAVKQRYAQDAIDALLAGKPVPVPVTKGIGCSIKFHDKQ